MDVEDFTRQVKPRKNGSQLLPFQKEISDLKRQGYSDEQIREWLAQNNIAVSRENVRKFIKRHLPNLSQEHQTQSPANPASTTKYEQAPAKKILIAQTTSDAGINESVVEKLRRLTEEQRSEAEKARFKHDKTGNNH